MQIFKKIIFNWLPAFVWMGLIFYLSSRSRVVVSETYIVNFLIFKMLHIIEYAILYLLLFRGFYIDSKRKISGDKFLVAFIIATIYAMTDEIHQTFVLTREGRLRDVIIDSIGISIMYIYIRSHLSLMKKYLV